MAQAKSASVADGLPPFGPGLYLHFPFCHSRCGYCDFFTAVGPSRARAAFVADLLREIRLAAGAGDFSGERFRTVFFGGGTPSLLSPTQMTRLLAELRRRFDLDPEAEITAECNPESLTPGRMAAYREAGVNRISLGVQSMDAEDLRVLDRPHGVREVEQRVKQLRRAGFNQVSLDLIYGLPGRRIDAWKATLEAALALEPDHLSAYLLTLEPKVPLQRKLREAGQVLPGDDTAREQYEWLCRRAEQAGLYQYEISNFARPGCESRHNQNYWIRGDYLGLGPSAHSHRQGRRWANVSSMTGYREAVRGGTLPRVEDERATPGQAAAEWIFLGLRRAQGVPWSLLTDAVGPERLPDFEARVRRLEQSGLVAGRDGWLRLTRPAFFVSNGVFVELMEALD